MTTEQARKFADAFEREYPGPSLDESRYSRALLQQLDERRGLMPAERWLLRAIEADLADAPLDCQADLLLRSVRALEREVRCVRTGAAAPADGGAGGRTDRPSTRRHRRED